MHTRTTPKSCNVILFSSSSSAAAAAAATVTVAPSCLLTLPRLHIQIQLEWRVNSSFICVPHLDIRVISCPNAWLEIAFDFSLTFSLHLFSHVDMHARTDMLQCISGFAPAFDAIKFYITFYTSSSTIYLLFLCDLFRMFGLFFHRNIRQIGRNHCFLMSFVGRSMFSGIEYTYVPHTLLSHRNWWKMRATQLRIVLRCYNAADNYFI